MNERELYEGMNEDDMKEMYEVMKENGMKEWMRMI